MENKEFTQEDFDRFAEWWLSKREYAKKIANALCNQAIYDIFISTPNEDNKLRIEYTYYEYSDDHSPTAGYFPVDYLFDPNSIEKAKAEREEEKRQDEIRRKQLARKDELARMENARREYEYYKKKLEETA